MKRVVLVSHSDADGHLIAEQTRRNLSAIPTFDVSTVVDPSRTMSHRAWTRLDAIPEIDGCDIVLFVDLMFAPDSFSAEADALVAFAGQRPDTLFFVLDHHPLPEARLSRAPNVRFVYQPDVLDCTFGSRSWLMVWAALAENQPTRAVEIKMPEDDLLTRGIKRAAAPGGPLPGKKLLALLRCNRWEELKELGRDDSRFHRLPRGRRPVDHPISETLARLDQLAADLLGARSCEVFDDCSAGRDAMSYDFDGTSDRTAPAPQIPVSRRRDLEAIVTLLHLAAIYLTHGERSSFTLEQLLEKVRELGGEEINLEEFDIKLVLGKTGFLKRHAGGRLTLK